MTQNFRLLSHPDAPPNGVRGVSVEIIPTGEGLLLTYRIDGAPAVAFPDKALPVRADELWKTTCFELFLKPDGGDGYIEFNFSPSGRWAAYQFDGHRTGMRDLPLTLTPHIEMDKGEPDAWDVGLELHDLPVSAYSMGITVVIEELDGTKSFWALEHKPGSPAPDFHNADCFTARLPAPEQP
jgi:hypothetical protein